MIKRVIRKSFEERLENTLFMLAMSIFLILGLFYVSGFLLTMRFSDARVILFFIVYLFSIFIFSIIYFHLYSSDKKRFSIANDLVKRREIDDNCTLSRLNFQKHVLDILAKRYEAKEISERKIAREDIPAGVSQNFRPSHFETWNYFLIESDTNYCLLYQYIVKGPNSIAYGTELLVGNEGGQIGDELRYNSYSIASFDFLVYLQDASARCAERCERLSTHNFSYVDFLYFSTITQTTVGFGDIVPNSSTIRLLVVAQILIGYIILAVLINLSFNR